MMGCVRTKPGKDPLIYGFVAGLLGVVGDEVVHWSAVFLYITRSTTGHYLSQLIFPHQQVIVPKLLLGEFTHFLAGGILGIVMLIIFLVAGGRFGAIKGIGFSLAMWIVHVAIIPNLISPRPYIYRTFNEALVDMAAHVAWGAITGWFLLFTFFRETGRAKKETIISTRFCLCKKLISSIIRGRFSLRSKRLVILGKRRVK